MMTALLLLRLNGVEIGSAGEELIRIALAIAQGTMSIGEFAGFLRAHANGRS